MNMARRTWQIAVMIGFAVGFVIVMVITFAMQKPDSVMAEGEENTAPRNNTAAEFGASGPLRIDGIGQMGHGHQGQSAVENAKNLIPIKFQTCHITLDLFIGGGITKTQVTVL